MASKGRYFLACFMYAGRGSVSRANTLSTVVGAALLYVLNMLTGWKIPLPEGVPGLFVGAFYCFAAMWIVILIVRFVGAALHFALEPHNRPLVILRQRLGTQMWPVILMTSGLLAFVSLFGTGIVMFALSAHQQKPDESKTKKYLAYDIERQLRAIDGIREILTIDLPREQAEAVTLNRDVSQQLMAGTVRNNGIATRLTQLSDAVETDLTKIRDIVETHSDYPYFRESIKYDPFNPASLISGARNVAAEINQLSADADSKYLLRSQALVEFASAGQSIGNWAGRCDQNLATSRQAVEALPVYENNFGSNLL